MASVFMTTGTASTMVAAALPKEPLLSPTTTNACLGSSPTSLPVLNRTRRRVRSGRSLKTRALPQMLDLAILLNNSLDQVSTSIDEEIVIQATLHAPVTHVLQCHMEAYGVSPFAAPDLQANPMDPSADQEFAACVASPPDIDEAQSLELQHGPSLQKGNAVRETLVLQLSSAGSVTAELVRQESSRSRARRQLGVIADMGKRSFAQLLGMGLMLIMAYADSTHQWQLPARYYDKCVSQLRLKKFSSRLPSIAEYS